MHVGSSILGTYGGLRAILINSRHMRQLLSPYDSQGFDIFIYLWET